MNQVNVNVKDDFSQQSEYTANELPDGTGEALTAYLGGRQGWVSFDDIRANVTALENAEQGVIHQACFDAGFTGVEVN